MTTNNRIVHQVLSLSSRTGVADERVSAHKETSDTLSSVHDL